MSAVAMAGADQIRNSTWGYYINIPRGWVVIDDNPDSIAFSDPSGTAVIQILAFPGDAFSASQGIADFVISRLAAQGDQAPFAYNGREAVFGDLSFDAGGLPARGMFFFLEGEKADYTVQSFTAKDKLEEYSHVLFSALDSFSPTDEGMTAPGPVAQFLRSPGEADLQRGTITIGGNALPFSYNPEGIQLSQEVINREAQILSAYDPSSTQEKDWKAAWKRYYRMIYRDSYTRLQGAAQELRRYFNVHETPREEIPAILLSWLQDFEFLQTGGIADLESPLSCVVNERGDCDSLGLVFLILLDYLEIDGALFVSLEYGHSLAGVAVPGKGARIPVDGTDYLVAELTDPVDLGLISKDMADPSKWLGITFYPY
jgi:hypothetical protein